MIRDRFILRENDINLKGGNFERIRQFRLDDVEEPPLSVVLLDSMVECQRLVNKYARYMSNSINWTRTTF